MQKTNREKTIQAIDDLIHEPSHKIERLAKLLKAFMSKELMSRQGNQSQLSHTWPILTENDYEKVCFVIKQVLQEGGLEGEEIGPIMFYLYTMLTQ